MNTFLSENSHEKNEPEKYEKNGKAEREHIKDLMQTISTTNVTMQS